MAAPADEDVVRLVNGEAVFGRIEEGPDERFLYLRRRDGLHRIPMHRVDRIVSRAST